MSLEKSKSTLNWLKTTCIVGATCVSMNVFAGQETVWSDSARDVVKEGAGNCLHTIWWKGGGCGNENPDTHKHGAKEHTHSGGSVAHNHDTHKHGTKEHTHDGGSLDHNHEAKAAPAPAPVVKAAPVPKPFSLSSAAAFKTSGSTLSAGGKAEVKAFADKLKNRQVKSITVVGYTDSRGAAAFNQSLSEKRAAAVKAEMIRNGIDGSLIETSGKGESNPIADNNTTAGRAKNRRVNVTVEGLD